MLCLPQAMGENRRDKNMGTEIQSVPQMPWPAEHQFSTLLPPCVSATPEAVYLAIVSAHLPTTLLTNKLLKTVVLKSTKKLTLLTFLRNTFWKKTEHHFSWRKTTSIIFKRLQAGRSCLTYVRDARTARREQQLGRCECPKRKESDLCCRKTETPKDFKSKRFPKWKIVHTHLQADWTILPRNIFNTLLKGESYINKSTRR